MLEHALSYAARGWAVFPLRPRDKIPLVGTQGHLDACTDAAQIKQWWLANPTANIGIALAPSGLTVLDVDVGPNKGGYDALKTLHAAHPITGTLTAITGGGGMHIVYARPEGVPAKRRIDFLHRLIETENKGSGLDLLGDGYIVAAPSIHKSGKAYAWQDPNAAVAPLPDTLSAAYATATPATERPLDGQERSIGEGGRDNALFRLGCALRDTGITKDALEMALYAENQLRCNPPLEQHEVARIVYSVMARVVPTRDILSDTVFAKSVLPADAQPANQLDLEPDRVSYGLDQLADMDAPIVTLRSTGVQELDNILHGGLPERDVTLLVGPPGSGKSAWALAQCLRPGAPSLYVSTELDTNELRARIAAQDIGCSWLEILQGKRAQADVRAALGGKTLRVIGADMLPGVNLQERLTKISEEIARIIKDTGFAPLVVFDYVQDLARGVPKGDTDEEGDAVSVISRYIRVIAKWSGSPIITVSSTARGWYGSHGEITHAQGFLGTGKNSGDLEFDAAVVLYLDVIEEASPDGSRAARIAVAKARHATMGFAGVRFRGAQGGRWESDPKALEDFTKASKVDKAQASQFSEDDAFVLKRVSEYGADPMGVLQYNCGIPATRAKRSMYRLMEAGKLEMRKEARTGQDHRTKTVDVIGIPVIR